MRTSLASSLGISLLALADHADFEIHVSGRVGLTQLRAGLGAGIGETAWRKSALRLRHRGEIRNRLLQFEQQGKSI